MKQTIGFSGLRIVAICIVLQLMVVSAIAGQERMFVKSNSANIRMEPDVKSKKLWEVEKYHPLIVIEKKGKWCRIKDYQGDIAWVHSTLLGKGKTVITKVKASNVRSKATTKSSILFTVARGVPFKVLESTNTWLKVKHADGDIGWISKKLVW